MEAADAREGAPIEAPERWGLGPATVGMVAERVRAVWERYRTCFRTQTRDTSENAWIYLRGLLTMDQERTFANIARRVQGSETDSQRVQHFMSASPWSAHAVIAQVRAEVAATPVLREGSVLILDESWTKAPTVRLVRRQPVQGASITDGWARWN